MVGTQEKLDGKWTELILCFLRLHFVTQSILINGDLDLKVGGVWLHLPGFRTGWNHPMDFPHGYGSQVIVVSQRRLQEEEVEKKWKCSFSTEPTYPTLRKGK